MKIKSRVWYWLAAASGAVSLLYGMGIEGHDYNEMGDIVAAHLRGIDSFNPQDTAIPMALARRYGRVDRTHARTEEPEYRQNRRGA